jgi:hypothetical protein
LSSQACLLTVVRVEGELAIDRVAHTPLQGSQRFFLTLAFGEFALVIGPSWGVVADLSDRGHMQRMIELAVTGRVEPMTDRGPLDASIGAVAL